MSNYTEQQKISVEEAVTAANEMILDTFRNDPLYVAAFNHGDFGDIDDADFETFGNVKTYIADTIFATEHQGQQDDSGDSDDYTPSGDEGPQYLDVSEYYENGDFSTPKVYETPEEVQMPEELKQYYTKKRFAPEDRPYEGYKGDGDLSDRHPERQAQVDVVWKDVRRWRHNVREIIGKAGNLDAWRYAAGVGNINSKKDSDRIKAYYRAHDGKLPPGADPAPGRSYVPGLDQEFKQEVKDFIGKDQDWKEWAKAAGVGTLNSKNDSEKIKKFYTDHDGKLPEYISGEQKLERHNKRRVKEIIGSDQNPEKWLKAAGVNKLNSNSDFRKLKDFFKKHNGVLPT